LLSPKESLDFPIKTIGEACRQQAQALIQVLILHTHDLLKQDVNVQVIFEALFSKQDLFFPAATA